MSLIRWSPSWDPFQEMEETMKTLMPVSTTPALHKGFVPAMDVYETPDAVVVETPLAGVNPKDVEVSVHGGVLTLKGESKKEHEVEDKNYYRKEVRSGSFYREVALPTAVQEEQIDAVFENGILKITCPKSPSGVVKKVNVRIAGK